MPTRHTVTIMPAGGGDYTALIAWNSARRRDLVALDEIERAECYSGNVGSTNVFGWTMDATRYAEIVVAAGHQHAGKWDTSKCYMLAGVNGINIIDVGSLHLRVRGLQIQHNASLNSLYGIRCTPAGFAGIIEQCIIRRTGTGLGLVGIAVTGGVVRNNWVDGYDMSGGVGFFNLPGAATKYFNNTATRNTRGFSFAAGSPTSRNNLAALNADGFFGALGDHDYNASDLANDAPGANSRNSQTFTFADPSGGDYHLRITDQGATGHGQDLSLLFADDIDAQPRIGRWDIGADQHDPSAISDVVGQFFRRTDLPGAWSPRTDLDGPFLHKSTLGVTFDPSTDHAAEFGRVTTVSAEFDLVTEITQ